MDDAVGQQRKHLRRLKRLYELYGGSPENVRHAVRLLAYMRQTKERAYGSVTASGIESFLNLPSLQYVQRWPGAKEELSMGMSPGCQLTLTTPLGHRRLWCRIEYPAPRTRWLRDPKEPSLHFVGLGSQWSVVNYGSIDFSKALRAIGIAGNPEKVREQFAHAMNPTPVMDYEGELKTALERDNVHVAWALLHKMWWGIFPK